MEAVRSPHPRRYLAHALTATLSVILVPPIAVTALQASGHVRSGVVALLLGAALSIALAAVGARLWARQPGSRDIVFSDLMLWGFVRRLRTERRLAEAHGILGITRTGALEMPDVDGNHAAEVLERLGAALEARDAYTQGHTKRVARHSHMIATAMGLSEEQIAKVRTAAAVRDVGKARTPRSVINKPRRLNAVQEKLMRRHAVDGAKMAESIGDPEITAMVRHHHERLDGAGYPDGLRGEEIPLGARIIAVADTFDAMTSARAYRSAMRHSRALKILRREAGTQLDPDAVAAFAEYYSGQRSVAWWAIWTTAPQRMAAWIGSLLNTTGAASISQSLAAAGTAAAIAGGAVETTRHERDAHRASRSAAIYGVAPDYVSGGTALPEEPLPVMSPPAAGPSAPDHRREKETGTVDHGDGVRSHPADGAAPNGAPQTKPPKSERIDSKPGRESGGSTSPKKGPDPVSGIDTKPGKGHDKPSNPPATGLKPKPEPGVGLPPPSQTPPKNGDGGGQKKPKDPSS
jgi:putative nucleotidyltransferase with HDIG domain